MVAADLNGEQLTADQKLFNEDGGIRCVTYYINRLALAPRDNIQRQFTEMVSNNQECQNNKRLSGWVDAKRE